ncbi:MAG: TonB-dependent receptor [Gemmatimonadales bacterium]
MTAPTHAPAGAVSGPILVAMLIVFSTGVEAQIRPDSLPADSVPSDTVVVAVPDGTAPDQAPDTASADTIFYNLPPLARPSPGPDAPPPFVTGVWEWDHGEIMESGASTLAELVAEVPGLLTLLGGDYGTPTAITAFGTGGGGYRVIRDGMEVTPLAGGVTDLQHVGLGGIERVRLERSGGEMLVELTSYRYEEGRALALIEAGTGQLDTNMFRGLYADPTALRGSLGFALERVDTRSYGQDEGGNRTGTWMRYQLHLRDRAGLAFDYRRMNTETQVAAYASSVRRNDVAIRARADLFAGVAAEIYTAWSSHRVDDTRDAYDFEGGTRAQYGARLAATRGGLWARGEARLFPDDDLRDRRVDAAVGYDGARLGLEGRVARGDWEGRNVVSWAANGWISPLPGVTLFGSWDEGTYAARTGPLLDVEPVIVPPDTAPTPPPPPTFVTSERRVLRAGGSLTALGATAAAAALRVDADAFLPLGLELDRGAPVALGGKREGIELWGSLPTPWPSLRLEGSYQRWDQDAPYLPREIYRGAFVFHRTYLESGNFELWWSVGVRGHDPMQVFVPTDGTGQGLATVPFYQSWYGRIQARILTVRLFLTWENFTIRRNLQNFPGRVLPVTRSFFGLHWDLWN